LMVYNKAKLIAVLPANKVDNSLYSHQGLTYGGFLFGFDLNNSEFNTIINSVLRYLRMQHVDYLELKLLPDFYQKKNSKMLLDNLIKSNAFNFRTDKVLAIDYHNALNIHKTKLKHFRKNKNKGFEIKEESGLNSFWNEVLIPRLKEKHNVNPVHSLEEISALKLNFPEKIRQFNIYLNERILAGITIFDKGKIIKSQYGATTRSGQEERALEFLFIHLIEKFKAEGRDFFSMGTVRDEKKPLGYNEGLLKQKEELGCSIFYQHFYGIDIV
jgi:hypothetical protein